MTSIMNLKELLEHFIEVAADKDQVNATLDEYLHQINEADKAELRTALEFLKERQDDMPATLNTSNMIEELENKLGT